MDATNQNQRMQAYALIDALPMDSLEIVMALMRKLADYSRQSKENTNLSDLSDSEKESLNKVRKLAGCFSACHSDDWRNEKSSYLEDKYHQ